MDLKAFLLITIIFLSCAGDKKTERQISVEWQGNKAVSMHIPRQMLPAMHRDTIASQLLVQLENSEIPILGDYVINDYEVIVTPMIPFTIGMKYEVRFGNIHIGTISITPEHALDTPVVINIYPSADTVPLNLLKMYIRFSKPMQEGQALEHITVIKNGRDTMPSIFLDLQQELWNKEGNMLTLWLDPGRIKRDLQPNRNLGAPLEIGISYKIVINKEWRDVEGVSLKKEFSKIFTVGERDGTSPDPEKWNMNTPQGGDEPLNIKFNEELDYALLKNTIRIIDSKGKNVPGQFQIEKKEMTLQFIPSTSWQAGEYMVEFESRLEDLAGNNLNRLFDEDLSKVTSKKEQEVYRKKFQVK